MSAIDLAAALAAGVTFVTPNNRLARALVARHDARMRARGLAVWPAARALPWRAWVRSLWLDALAANALAIPRPLQADAVADFLWDRIVARDSDLLDPQGAAVRAREAWTLFHAWRTPAEHWGAWAHAGIADDAAAFAVWADRYAAEVAGADAVDAAVAADLLAQAAVAVPAWRGVRIALAGFLDHPPQQARLLSALSAAGMQIERIELPLPREHPAALRRVVAATPRAELELALGDARARALADPHARIGIVIADLDDRRHDVLAAADDILCPELAARPGEGGARPYSVSLGTRLPDLPLVATAMALLAWSGTALALDDAAIALRSPYLPDAQREWTRRAGLELAWRRLGLRDVTFAAATTALSTAGRDSLAARWRAAVPPPNVRQSPLAWSHAWRAWLDQLGWPGDRPLDSAEWQARERLFEAFGAFADLSAVARTLSRDEALHALRATVARIVFQPETSPARIEILGTLEASGLEFDALWLAGMTAERWPARAAPNPLLPLAWQRQRGVPRADAAHSLAFAEAATAAFARAAATVTASHAARTDGAETTGASLFARWPLAQADGLTGASRVATIAAVPGMLEAIDDAAAPALAEGHAVRGGVDIVESQSTCAFQAFGRHRLGARDTMTSASGLGADERGTLLHRALKAFWDDVGDHAALMELSADALAQRIARAVAAARGAVDAARWRALPPPVAAAETLRLEATLAGWLTAVERERPPFATVTLEAPAELTLGGLALRFRVDRVDVLADGGLAIIDYKSGRAPGPARWFAERPSGTQLGQYVLAWRDHAPGVAVRAVAYAQLKAGDVTVTGLAADGGAWPALRTPDAVKNAAVADWADAEAQWRVRYGALAAAFRQGDAAVQPRDAQACRYCDLQPVCRVHALEAAAPDAGEGDRDDE